MIHRHGLEETMHSLSVAPSAWWRPPPARAWLLDAVAADALPPVGIVASDPAGLLPALIRLPEARCLTIRPWSAADLALLPGIAAFAGRQPIVEALATTPPASLQSLLLCEPVLPLPAGLAHQLGTRLRPSGMLAVVLTPAVGPAAVLSVLRLRRALRRAGTRVERTSGCLGPRALTWSALARLALAAGRPDRYDRYHAAMRAAFPEPWPLALACRTVAVVARRVSC
jgi:hypothetical protein